MNYTKIILAGLITLSSTAFAMPTSEQTKKVEPLVVDLMRDDQAALKSGKKTRVEVAESAMSLADQAESEAAKLLLMKGAFNLYVRAGEFDKAIETLQSLQTAIPDIPPSNMANIIETSLRSVPRKNGGQLYRLLDETKTRMRYTNEAASLEKSVKKTPTDRALRLKLAEHYAYLGKWDLALENFAASGGKVSVVAKSERDGEAAMEKIADFWWDYPTGKAEELAKGFRVHAAKLYEDAIAAGAVTGLNKVQAERRIEETKGYGEYDMSPSMSGKGGKDLYMIVDLVKTGKAAISYLGEVPKNGWSDEYKTNKIVLRKIAPGSFEYLPGRSFKITKPFYIGVFEVTQKQYEMTMKVNPSEFKGDMRPVEKVSYIDIRGPNKGLGGPRDNLVDDDSYLGRLRKRIGLEFDLPTEVQWEYACRAGTKGDFNVDGVEMVKLGKCKDNGGFNDHHVKVGSFHPNAWGLYDMHGNVWEWCLDRVKDGSFDFDWKSEPKETDTDPWGSAVGESRIVRGGGWHEGVGEFRFSYRCRHVVDRLDGNGGFRLACPVKATATKQVSERSTVARRLGVHCEKVRLWDGGPYWADMNIGAKKPWDSGYYFWWGDTVGYKRENDAWVASDGSSSGFQFGEAVTPTYDRAHENLQNEGWITADNELESKHDAAQVHWGGEWRLPTQQELEDLKNNCDWKWTTMKGVSGYVVCGRGAYASASIFLPAAGVGYGNALNDADSQGQYWASVPNTGKFCSWRLELNSSDYVMGKGGRSYGRTVRPVQGFTKSAAKR